MRRLTLALALALAGPCAAAPTVTPLGTATAAGGSATLALATTADCPPGAWVVLTAADTGTPSVSGVADNAATPNTYGLGTQFAPSAGKAKLANAPVTADLPAGGQITVTFSATGGTKLVIAVCVTGLTGVDLDGTPTSGTAATSYTQTTGTLSQASEIVFDAFVLVAGAGDVITEDAAFTSDGSLSSTALLHLAHRIVSATTPVAYAASGTGARDWAANSMTFAAAAGASGAACALTLMGAGAC